MPITFFNEELWVKARRAGLLPLVAAAYSARFGTVPDDVGRDVVLNAMHNVRATAELAAVQTLFDRAGLRWMVLKGPVLAHVVYRVPGVRVYGDIDVLVHPDDLERCLDLLLSTNSTLLDRNWAHILRTGQSEISLELEHGTLLDLHWHPITNPDIRADIGLDLHAMFRRAHAVSFGGVTAPTLDALDTVCYTSLHAVLSGAHQLRWLIDVQECLIRADAAPLALRERAVELGCLLAVEVVIGRIATHLDPTAWRHLSGRRRSFWARCCSLPDRFAVLDPGLDRYSGRAVFSSTRATNIRSLIACFKAVERARRIGQGRRLVTSSVEVLRREGGTEHDKQAWLDLARQYGDATGQATNLGGHR